MWGKSVVFHLQARRVFVLGTVLASLLLVSLPRAHAVDPERHISQYGHTAWRVQDGFFDGAPWSIAQTADGYLWIGGANGLLRFDGVHFVPWTPPPGKQLLSPAVARVLAARDGGLWIGTMRGLSRWTKQDLINYSSHADVMGPTIEEENGATWVIRAGIADGTGPLCQVNGMAVRCYGKADGIPEEPYSSLARDSAGNLWLGGSTSLTRWRPGSFQTYYLSGLKSNTGQPGVCALAPRPDGSLWVGICNPGPGLGLQQFSQGVWKPFVAHGFDSSTLPVLTLFMDRQNALWVGTIGQGIYRIHGGEVDHFGRSEGLSGDAIYAFFEDREGNLWVATDQGLDCFRDLQIRTFSTREGLTTPAVGSVQAMRDGAIWIGGENALDILAAGLGQGSVRSVQTGKGLPGNQVTSLFEDHAGRHWVGIDNTLNIYENGRFTRVARRDGSPTGMILGITEDVNNNLWVLSFGPPRMLIRIFDRKVQEELPTPQIPAASSLVADPRGGVWLGLLDGDLARYQQTRAETFRFEHPPNSRVNQVMLSSDGSVLGATTFGLIGWSNGKQQTLSARNGLPCDAVNGLVEDGSGALWLYMQCGLVEIARRDLQRWWAQPNVSLQPRVFDVFDGFQSGNRAPFESKAVRTLDGRLWFANAAVVQMIDPSHLARNPIAPPVHVEQLIADGKGCSLQGNVRLPARTRDVEIDYTALSFAVPQKVRFRYRLEGRDTDWQEAGTRRQAFYTDLRPGTYRFHVIACNNTGLWNEAGASLDFFVAPAYYQTNWFRLSCVAVFIALLWSLHRWRIRQLRGQEKRLRDIVETIPEMTFTTLSDGSNTFVNKRWTEYTGLSAEKTSGAGWQRAIHPEDLVRHSEKWRISVATGQVFEDEARFRRAADGEYRWFLVRGVPLRDEHGNIVRWYGTLTDIEDRKRAEEALQLTSHDLQDSKAKLEDAQRITHVGYWEWDLLTDRVNWSDETYRIYGLRPQERPIDIAVLRQMIHPGDLEFVFRTAEDALRGGARPNIEHRIVRPSGEVRTVYSQGDMKRDVSGRPYQMFGTVQDITHRKRAEEALQQSQFYLAEGQRLAHMGSWAFNPSGLFDYWSPELFQIYGLDPQKGAPTLEQYLATVHPQDRDFMGNTIKRMLAEHGGCDVKKRIVFPDGEQRYIRCVGIPVVEGEVLKGFLGTAMDITEQELLTRELEFRQVHLAEAQKLTHTGSWVWRVLDRNAVHLSAEWYRIYGFDPAEGPPVWEKRLERVHPEDRAKWKGTIERAIMEKADYEVEFRIVIPNGEVKWIHTVGHPVLSDTGDLEQFVGSSTDITERKRAEQEREKLRQLETDLAHLNRVTMLGELATSLAHEINQPIAATITSANACLRWLAHDPPDLERARAATMRIEKDGNRAAEIIQRLRAFYKTGAPPQRELVDINEVVDEMLVLLRNEATRHAISMRTELAPQLPRIVADRVQLQQVLMNLMLNGIEAVGDEAGAGELTVRSQRTDDGLLLVSVSDTGGGLPSEEVDRIFSAFFTTKPQGTGMGLAISRSIIEAHGGRLWATANDGRGATFHFALPAEAQQ